MQRACWMQQFRINILSVAQMQDIGIELGNSMCKLCISHFMITKFTETKKNILSLTKKEKKKKHCVFFYPPKLKSSFGF